MINNVMPNYNQGIFYPQQQNYTVPVALPYAPQFQYQNSFSYPSQYYLFNQTPIVPKGIQTEGANGAWKLTEVAKTPYGDNLYKYTLKNGQTVVLAPKENAATIIKTFVNAGSMNENDLNRGISHFNEHNVFNGSKNLASGKFFKEVGRLGAETNASTDYAVTDFYIMSPLIDDKSLKEIIELHSDMLVNPTFPEDMVEKEKGPVTSEISMCNDDITNNALTDLVRNLFQINSKSENLVAGSIETVNNITRDDVYNHWKNHFTPDNMYTVLTGDFDPNTAIDIISKKFTTPAVNNPESLRTKEKLTPIQKSVRTDYISPNGSSTNVFCAFAGPTPNDSPKEKVSLIALGLLLLGNNNARLTKELNSMYAMGDFSAQKVGLEKTDPKAIIYQFATQRGDDTKAIEKFYDAIKSISKNPPTEDEMAIIKNTLLKGLAFNYEDSEATADTIGAALLNNEFSSICEDKKLIENLTPEDLIHAANKYFDFNKMSVAAIHPHDMTEKEIQNNYKAGAYSKFNTSVSFTGRTVSTKENEQIQLSDNTVMTFNNSTTDNCYLDWRLSAKDCIPENPACAYVLTQILNDGSKYKSKEDFSHEAGLNSVEFDTNANCFQIRSTANSLYTNLDDAIKTMKEAIYAPRFTQADFDAAVDKIKTYCSAMEKDASTNLLAQLYGKYFPSPKQIIKGLETLILDDVKKHYNNLIFNSSSNVVISAPFEKHPELKNTAKNLMTTQNIKFKQYAPKLLQSYIPNEKETVLVDTEERNQAQIYKNYSFEISGNIIDEVKFELLNTILGGSPSSRLFQDLREKQKLAYSVSSQIQSFENSGILTMKILSTTDDKKQNDIKYDNLQKSLDGFKNHTDKLMTEYISDEELESAKMQLKQNIALEMGVPDMAVSLLSMNMTQPFGIKRIDEYVKTIDKITKEDIRQAACHIFSNKPVYSILASPDTIANQKNYINSLGEVINL